MKPQFFIETIAPKGYKWINYVVKFRIYWWDGINRTIIEETENELRAMQICDELREGMLNYDKNL